MSPTSYQLLHPAMWYSNFEFGLQRYEKNLTCPNEIRIKWKIYFFSKILNAFTNVYTPAFVFVSVIKFLNKLNSYL